MFFHKTLEINLLLLFYIYSWEFIMKYDNETLSKLTQLNVTLPRIKAIKPNILYFLSFYMFVFKCLHGSSLVNNFKSLKRFLQIKSVILHAFAKCMAYLIWEIKSHHKNRKILLGYFIDIFWNPFIQWYHRLNCRKYFWCIFIKENIPIHNSVPLL